MPRTSPTERCLSSSSFTRSSMARISAIVRPYQRSVEQKTWLQFIQEKLVYILIFNLFIYLLTDGSLWRDVARTSVWSSRPSFAGQTIWTHSWPVCSRSSRVSHCVANRCQSRGHDQFSLTCSCQWKRIQLVNRDKTYTVYWSIVLTFLDPLRPCSLMAEWDRWQCRCGPRRVLSASRVKARAPEITLNYRIAVIGQWLRGSRVNKD